MMIFLTPHVYYGDDNAIAPKDYFGDEVEKMLDKHDLVGRRDKEKKDKQTMGTNPDSLKQANKGEKKHWHFRWPWRREPDNKKAASQQ
jgi:hypothetical protein